KNSVMLSIMRSCRMFRCQNIGTFVQHHRPVHVFVGYIIVIAVCVLYGLEYSEPTVSDNKQVYIPIRRIKDDGEGYHEFHYRTGDTSRAKHPAATYEKLSDVIHQLLAVNMQNISDNIQHQEKKIRSIKHKNIMFLKLHKTASSTMQNIFFRYVDSNALNIALPKSGLYSFSYPKVFSPSFVKPSIKPFNVMCNHLRYHRSVHSVMPADTKYITIIRNPDSQFISSFNYFNFPDCFKQHGIKTINDFARVLPKGTCANVNAQNSMLYDLGVSIHDITNMNVIKDKIIEAGKIFDLVMLSEYIDEGLILMRDMLQWKNEDILYMNKLVSQTPQKKISTKTRNILREYNKGDVLLYEYFNKTFWLKAQRYGLQKLILEVQKFREFNQKWFDFCVDGVVSGDQIRDADLKADYNDDIVLGYNLNEYAKDSEMCHQLATQEIHYHRKLEKRMKRLGNVKTERVRRLHRH
ncbi:unnamed protein product, partial [Owenia fusiformis]